ncbi:MFS transporter [Kutzneria sp. NPDC052558]|uniref:MFS transporter n=1 Tax=Kutzneria sp. NPDC052558 TaxID=3364121 RepID=UPI0037CB5D71
MAAPSSPPPDSTPPDNTPSGSTLPGSTLPDSSPTSSTPSGSATPSGSTGSAWAPLAARAFRALWLAQFASNLGTWVQSVGAQWLLLDHGPTVVALVQTAGTLPVFLFALPAGVLADLADRKRLLVWAQLGMTVVAALLAVATFTGGMTPGLLLTLTFLLGCGSALVGPAWQAIQPELVPREQLKQASALGAVNMNIARAVGPALGGLLVSLAGVGWTFALNAASFVVILVALQLWRRPPQARPNETEREHAVAAVRAGVRYLRHAPGIRRILFRSMLFVPAASALWALLPTISAQVLHLDSSGYGLMLGALGIGAVAGALGLPAAAQRVSGTAMLMISGAVFAAVTAVLPLCPNGLVAAFPLVLAGAAWIGVLSTLNAAMQLTLAGWVRARGLAFYLVVFMGGQAFGAAIWGVVAGYAGLTITMFVAAGLLVLGAMTGWWWPLYDGGNLDRSVASGWADPSLVLELRPTDGPVLVQIEYRVPDDRVDDFTQAMTVVERSRRRTGATSWGLHRDIADPELFLETFQVPSWSEHLAQHHSRYTGADHDVLDRARRLAEGEPTVRHALAAPSPPG